MSQGGRYLGHHLVRIEDFGIPVLYFLFHDFSRQKMFRAGVKFQTQSTAKSQRIIFKLRLPYGFQRYGAKETTHNYTTETGVRIL